MYECIFQCVLRLQIRMLTQAVCWCVCTGIRSWIRQTCPALCSVLCTVFPFKSGRLAHAGKLGFSCCQLSYPWQAVLRSGGSSGFFPFLLLCCTLSIIKWMGGPVTLPLVQFSNCCNTLEHSSQGSTGRRPVLQYVKYMYSDSIIT